MGEMTDKAKGQATEAVGDLTDNERLEREGEAQQRKAGAEREVARREAEARPISCGDEPEPVPAYELVDLVALDGGGRVRLTLVGGRVAFDALSPESGQAVSER